MQPSARQGVPRLLPRAYVTRPHPTPAGNLLEVLGQLHPRSQIEIRRKDITCMRPLEWLNDEVINLYMSLLQERDMRRRAVVGGAPWPPGRSRTSACAWEAEHCMCASAPLHPAGRPLLACLLPCTIAMHAL